MCACRYFLQVHGLHVCKGMYLIVFCFRNVSCLFRDQSIWFFEKRGWAMKFALNKRGRLMLACALTLGSATVAWTQLNGGPDVEWKDEIQASAPQGNAIPAEEDVLPEFKMEVSSKYKPDYSRLIASEDTGARQRQLQQDPLSVLTEEDQQESAVDKVLSQQSSVKISALVAGGSQFSPNPAPQYYAANARASLEGGAGGAGGGQTQDDAKDPQKPVILPIKDIPPQCDDKDGKKADGKPAKDCDVVVGDPTTPPTPPSPGPGEKPGGPNPGPDKTDEGGKDKPKPEVSVDEPSTLALFSLGLAGLLAMSRRRKKLA